MTSHALGRLSVKIDINVKLKYAALNHHPSQIVANRYRRGIPPSPNPGLQHT